MKYRTLFFGLLFLSNFTAIDSFATNYTDSLKKKLASTSDYEARFTIYELLFNDIIDKDPEIGEYYLTECYAIAKKANSKKLLLKSDVLKVFSIYCKEDLIRFNKEALVLEIALAEENLEKERYFLAEYIIMSHYRQRNFKLALQKAMSLDSLFDKNTDQKLVGRIALTIGDCYDKTGKQTNAISALQKALRISEKIKDNKTMCLAALSMGAIYIESANKDFALKYLTMAEKIANTEKDTTLIMQAQMILGNFYYSEKEFQKALDKYQKLKLFLDSAQNRNTYAGLLGNIGNTYWELGEREKGLQLQQEALAMFIKLDDKQGLTICYNTVGECYREKKDYVKALEYYKKSLTIAQEINSYEDLIEVHLNLSRAYESTNDFKNAYEHFKLYKQFNDSVFNENKAKKLTELELNYQFDNQQKQDELKHQLEQERYTRSKYLVFSGVLVLLLILIIIIRNNRQRKNANEQLQSFNSEIVSQKELIEEKNKEVEEKNKSITDSINYAKRIQNSILPPDNLFQALLPESFILYKPKDIVSGDFYWIEQKENEIIFAAVDCTGHGVPGAMMSVLGFNLLTQAVKEKNLTKPSEILNHLDNGVSTMLRQSAESGNVKDGMDLALCTLDLKTKQLQFAGAYNGLWIIKNGSNECIEVKPDKFPIGSNENGVVDQYTNHSLTLEKGDTVYIFTDGYADQFGGPKGKKFKYKQLESLLLENHNKPMSEQKQILDNTIETWKGSLEQVDDILVMGVRV